MTLKSDKVWMDGELLPYEHATIHVLTHTLHYGYGVFEGIRAYQRLDGQSHIFRLAEHMRRLFESAHILDLQIPFSQADLIKASVETLIANHFTEGYLRPIVFLGSEAMGLGALTNRVRVAILLLPWR